MFSIAPLVFKGCVWSMKPEADPMNSNIRGGIHTDRKRHKPMRRKENSPVTAHRAVLILGATYRVRTGDHWNHNPFWRFVLRDIGRQYKELFSSFDIEQQHLAVALPLCCHLRRTRSRL